MKIIFIDTNIYLDFYRPSKHSLDILTELIKLLEDKELKLILPKQVDDEFIRDKELVFLDFIKANLLEVNDPGFIDKNKIKRINSLLKGIKLDYEKKFFSNKSKININIKKLFELAEIPQETSELLNLAYYRTLRGNPPRKNNKSFGDAIIWETLLKNYSDKDLIIISRDGDFSSEINEKEIHPFLKYEWEKKNNKKIYLADTLGEVINKITKKETIKKEAIQEEKKVSADYWRKKFATMIVPSGIVNNFDLDSANYIPESSIPLQVNIDKGFAIGKVCFHCGGLIVGENSHCPICGL